MNYAQTIIDKARNFEHASDLADTECLSEGVYKRCPCWVFADNSVLIDIDGGLFETHSNFDDIRHEVKLK